MAKDLYHEACKKALEKDGWIITDDPLDLTIGGVELFADLGAERIIAAEKGTEKIAVEIKSFVSQSLVSEFHKALGQYENYKLSLQELEPERKIYLAIPQEAWNIFFQREFIKKVVEHHQIRVIVFNPFIENIALWTK